MSADGLGDEWSEHSISGEHNRLVGRRNSTSGMPLAMAAAINETEYTSAYTSLLPVDGGRAARLQYGRRTTPAIFSMLVQLKTEDTASTTAAASAAPSHPNIIMCALSARSRLSLTAQPELLTLCLCRVLTDDEDTVLGGDGHGAMPRGLPALTARGALATNWFVHTPVCACSRSEILTGRFFHNLLDDFDPEDPWDRHGNSNGPCARADEIAGIWAASLQRVPEQIVADRFPGAAWRRLRPAVLRSRAQHAPQLQPAQPWPYLRAAPRRRTPRNILAVALC